MSVPVSKESLGRPARAIAAGVFAAASRADGVACMCGPVGIAALAFLAGGPRLSLERPRLAVVVVGFGPVEMYQISEHVLYLPFGCRRDSNASLVARSGRSLLASPPPAASPPFSQAPVAHAVAARIPLSHAPFAPPLDPFLPSAQAKENTMMLAGSGKRAVQRLCTVSLAWR